MLPRAGVLSNFRLLLTSVLGSEQEERETQIPERQVRAGVQERPRAGRVAQPRRHARLHRGGRGGAHHRQRRAPGSAARVPTLFPCLMVKKRKRD